VRAAVLLVVGVEDKEHVEGLLIDGVGIVLAFGHAVHHGEEVAGVRELIVRVDVAHAHAVAIGKGGEGDDLADEPDDLEVSRFGVMDVFGIGIKGRQGGNRGHEHGHGMGVVAEAFHEVLDVLVDEGVVGEFFLPCLEFGRCGEFTV
jgi:hypothetical protein